MSVLNMKIACWYWFAESMASFHSDMSRVEKTCRVTGRSAARRHSCPDLANVNTFHEHVRIYGRTKLAISAYERESNVLVGRCRAADSSGGGEVLIWTSE